MFKAAIFDVDGTILDSMGMWERVLIKLMNRYGVYEITESDLIKYKDMIPKESIPLIKRLHSIEKTDEEMLTAFFDIAKSEYLNEIPIKPYCGEYLKKLHDSGVKIAIASSGYPDLCAGVFDKLGISQYIDARAFSHEVGVNKSNPDVYLLAASRLGVEACDCMVYEDIVPGINGAKKGGMMTTAVFDESNKDQTDELKSVADYYIESWKELL